MHFSEEVVQKELLAIGVVPAERLLTHQAQTCLKCLVGRSDTKYAGVALLVAPWYVAHHGLICLLHLLDKGIVERLDSQRVAVNEENARRVKREDVEL